jgi:hypothetical protein
MALTNPTTILPPNTLAALAAAGLDPTWFVERGMALGVAFQDTFDPLQYGLVGLRGDFQGRGTMTMRIGNVDGIGFSERLQALGSETARPTATGYSVGYTTLTVAPYGLAKKETFQEAIIGNPATRLSLDQLEAALPGSCMATLRYLACVTGSTVSANQIGATGVALGMDDIYDLRALLIGTPGAQARGRVRLTLDGAQLNQLDDSARSEPGIIHGANWSQAAQVNTAEGVDGNFPNWMGLNVDIGTTNDVQQSGGDYLGFGGSPGFIGWGRASALASNLPIPASAVPVYFPEWGVVIWRPTDGLGNLTNEVMVMQIVGTALGDPTVYFQTLVKSVV